MSESVPPAGAGPAALQLSNTSSTPEPEPESEAGRWNTEGIPGWVPPAPPQEQKIAERIRAESLRSAELVYHFFLGHRQVGGGSQVGELEANLKWRLGIDCWRDLSQAVQDLDAMIRGVAQSSVYLLYLTKGEGSLDALSYYVTIEARAAMILEKPVVVLLENDRRKGSFAGSPERAMAGWPAELREYFQSGRFFAWGGEPYEWSIADQEAKLRGVLEYAQAVKAPVPPGRIGWASALDALMQPSDDHDGLDEIEDGLDEILEELDMRDRRAQTVTSRDSSVEQTSGSRQVEMVLNMDSRTIAGDSADRAEFEKAVREDVIHLTLKELEEYLTDVRDIICLDICLNDWGLQGQAGAVKAAGIDSLATLGRLSSASVRDKLSSVDMKFAHEETLVALHKAICTHIDVLMERVCFRSVWSGSVVVAMEILPPVPKPTKHKTLLATVCRPSAALVAASVRRYARRSFAARTWELAVLRKIKSVRFCRQLSGHMDVLLHSPPRPLTSLSVSPGETDMLRQPSATAQLERERRAKEAIEQEIARVQQESHNQDKQIRRLQVQIAREKQTHDAEPEPGPQEHTYYAEPEPEPMPEEIDVQLGKNSGYYGASIKTKKPYPAPGIHVYSVDPNAAASAFVPLTNKLADAAVAALPDTPTTVRLIEGETRKSGKLIKRTGLRVQIHLDDGRKRWVEVKDVEISL